MAYLHCHTKNCGWSQDDFWDYHKPKKFMDIFQWQRRPFGYNPFSILLENIAVYWKPRYIIMDAQWARDQGFNNPSVHSWWFLKEGFKRYKRIKKGMLYKTYKEFMIDKNIGVAKCPNCGSTSEWDID